MSKVATQEGCAASGSSHGSLWPMPAVRVVSVADSDVWFSLTHLISSCSSCIKFCGDRRRKRSSHGRVFTPLPLRGLARSTMSLALWMRAARGFTAEDADCTHCVLWATKQYSNHTGRFPARCKKRFACYKHVHVILLHPRH